MTNTFIYRYYFSLIVIGLATNLLYFFLFFLKIFIVFTVTVRLVEKLFLLAHNKLKQ